MNNKYFVINLMDKFGTPSYIEKCPTTNEAYSVTFKNIDGFDMVRVLDSNTNKLHPYPAKIYLEGSLYFSVFSGLLVSIIFTTSGITSPARCTKTVSPILTSFLSISS